MTLLFQDNPYTQHCTAQVIAVSAREIRLDRTIFYPAAGGQPGDTGTLTFNSQTLDLIDTQKGTSLDDVVHLAAEGQSLPNIGTQVTAHIDWSRRYRHMRMHTTLHLLCALVPGAVTGGQIGTDKSRLDFHVPMSTLDRNTLSEKLNALISSNIPVQQRWITEQELNQNPHLVRTMSVAPPTGTGWVRLIEIENIDLQPCGGTHVARTGEIGEVEVIKIENKGKQNRRIVVALKT